MIKIILYSLLPLTLLLFTVHNTYAQSLPMDGKALFNQYCAACHGGSATMDSSQRVAPAIFAVKRHYIGSYPDEMSFVHAIAEWVEHRDSENTLMPGAIRRFNIMPAISIERQQLEAIARYIYSDAIATPGQFEQHYRKQHGLPVSR